MFYLSTDKMCLSFEKKKKTVVYLGWRDSPLCAFCVHVLAAFVRKKKKSFMFCFARSERNSVFIIVPPHPPSLFLVFCFRA